jgi:hypothetical protein
MNANVNHLYTNETELEFKSKLITNLVGEQTPESSNAPPGKQWTDYLSYGSVNVYYKKL